MPVRLKLGLIGDPHLAVPFRGDSADPYLDLDAGRKLHRQSRLLLESVLAAVNAEPELDAVLLLGDMTRDSELFNHEAAAELLARLRMPYFLMAGNHDFVRRREPGVSYPDVPRLDRDGFTEFYVGRGLLEPRTFYTAELAGGVDLHVLDSNRTLAELDAAGAPAAVQDHGWIAPEQLGWLERALEDSERAGRLPLLAVHHSVMEQSPVEQPGHRLEPMFRIWKTASAAALLELLARYRVPLALSGHLHAQSVNSSGGLTNLVTSATVAYPHCWRVLTVADDAIHVETRSLEPQLGAEFLAQSRAGLNHGWGELLEGYIRRQAALAPFAGSIRELVERSGWWPRFCDGTLAGFSVPPELTVTRNPVERAVLQQVAGLLSSYGPWKAARPDPNELTIPLP